MPDRGAGHSHRADTASVGLPTQAGLDGEPATAGPGRAAGTRLRTLAGHTGGVAGMAFPPAGGFWPAAAGRDGAAVDLTLAGRQLTGLGQRCEWG